MDHNLKVDANICLMRDATPIRFAYRKSTDRPQNHVLHLNNYVEIYIYVSGNHNYIVENNLYELKQGDIVIINPLEIHKALPLSETPYERFYFLIDCNAFDNMHLNPLAHILNKPAAVGNLISFDDDTRRDVLDMLYQIRDCFLAGKNDSFRALGYLFRILDEINQYLMQGRSSESTVTNTPELLEKILIYVAKHAAEIQSITEIATAIGISPQYLSSYFSKQIGTPLKNYVQAKKIALAKDLLVKGVDVTRTCYECGFNDCSYFIKIFKKYVGTTPMAYRTGKHKGEKISAR